MKNKKDELNILDRNYSSYLKGIAAVFIMIGHFLPKDVPIVISFFFSGSLWVGIFFFYSGYGLYESLNHNNIVITSFCKKKIKKVYIPYIFANVLYYFCNIGLKNSAFDFREFILVFLGIKLANPILWYVLHLIVIYAIFILLQKVLNTYKNIEFLWIIIYFTYLITSVILDIGNWWYISTFAFIVGIFFHHHKLYCKKLIKNKFFDFLIINCFIIIYFLLKYIELFNFNKIAFIPINYVITLMYMILVPLFIIFVAIIINLFKIEIENKFLIFLGSISYEIYLFHNICRLILTSWFYESLNPMLLIILEIIFSVLISIFIKKFKNNIENLFYRWRKE